MDAAKCPVRERVLATPGIPGSHTYIVASLAARHVPTLSQTVTSKLLRPWAKPSDTSPSTMTLSTIPIYARLEGCPDYAWL